MGRVTGLVATALLIGAAGGCSSDEPTADEPDDNLIPQVAVPPATGPQLVAISHRVLVRDRPSPAGKVLGTLRAGARVARAQEPYSKRKCAGGWYPIRPRGFVCAGDDATTNMNAPMAKVMAEGPNLDRALPYRYGRVTRGAAVAYGTLPTAEQQLTAEPKMHSRRELKPKRLGAGANDVPLDDRYVPIGVPVLQRDGEGVGPDGYRTSASYFVFAGPQTPPAPLKVGATLLAGADSTKTRVLKRKSGVAIVRSFVVGEGKRERRFGILPDGRFIPVDRLQSTMGTAWHGFDVSEIGLPVAFSLRRRGIRYWALKKNAKTVRTDEELEPGQPIALTGKFRTVNRTRFYFTRDDQWVRHKDIIVIHKRHKYPDFAAPGQKWLDISLANQTLTAWDGKKAKYATLISSGEDRLGDPGTGTPSTKRGVFQLRSKHITRNVDAREVKQAFSILDAPWVLDFAEGFAITGSYWQGRFGEARNYHNVTMAPIDAHWLWHWAAPDVPDGWHSVTVSEKGPATIIYIHK